MAQEAGQSNENNKQPEPYYGERKVKIGNIREDRRKLQQMMRVRRPRKGDK